MKCHSCGGFEFVDAIDNHGKPYRGCARCVIVWPAHLADISPVQSCDRCGRKTWTQTAFGSECGMPQPTGERCPGRFRAGNNLGNTSDVPRGPIR